MTPVKKGVSLCRIPRYFFYAKDLQQVVQLMVRIIVEGECPPPCPRASSIASTASWTARRRRINGHRVKQRLTKYYRCPALSLFIWVCRNMYVAAHPARRRGINSVPTPLRPPAFNLTATPQITKTRKTCLAVPVDVYAAAFESGPPAVGVCRCEACVGRYDASLCRKRKPRFSPCSGMLRLFRWVARKRTCSTPSSNRRKV